MAERKTWISKPLSVLLLTGGLTLIQPVPSIASVSEVCEAGSCTVTISYSGTSIEWIPPRDAKQLSFEIYGAQGGKSGGLGGKLTGEFTSMPERLVVTVGGAGVAGSGMAGGFNGGGRSGGTSNLEGSGGGATDLRIGNGLEDRVAVAGGGGGRGAGLGGTGGVGGGVSGGNGKTGQAGGGGGGTQLAGGHGGARNGTGTSGEAGSLGQGGAGGVGSLYGGGGGGGGYFGGGGGGSDTDSCCYDAGGGGGGSSYASPTLIRAAAHTQAARASNGLAVLRYQVDVVVDSISASNKLTNSDIVVFEVKFTRSVSSLPSDAVKIIGTANCQLGSVSSSGDTYLVELTRCGEGVVGIVLQANQVSNGTLSGPSSDVSSELVTIDKSPPVITSAEVLSASTLAFTFSEEVSFGVEHLQIASQDPFCQIEQVTETEIENTFVISLIGCELSDLSITLPANSLADLAGNPGPIEAELISISNKPLPEPTPDPTPDPTNEPEPSPEESPDPDPEPSGQPTVEPTKEPQAPQLVSGDSEAVAVDNPIEEDDTKGRQTENPADMASDLASDGQSPSAKTENGTPPMEVTDGIVALPEPIEQAAQLVVVPEQVGKDQSQVVIWLVIAGVSALILGLALSRKGLPASLAS